MNLDPIDPEKMHFYQLYVWTNSCSLRFISQSISSIVLIIINNISILLMISRDNIMFPLDTLKSQNQDIVNFTCLLNLCTLTTLNIFNHIIFCRQTRKE